MAAHEPIEWTDALRTGIDEIDRQHRILINTLNEANAKLAEDLDVAVAEQITKDLLSYAIYHFETEEDLMQDHGYDTASPQEAEAHQRQHREFSKEVIAVREGLKQGKQIVREELLAFLNGWLINHILNTDMKLAAHLLSKGQSSGRGAS